MFQAPYSQLGNILLPKTHHGNELAGQYLQSEWNLNLFQFEHWDFSVAHIERHFIISLKIKNKSC